MNQWHKGFDSGYESRRELLHRGLSRGCWVIDIGLILVGIVALAIAQLAGWI